MDIEKNSQQPYIFSHLSLFALDEVNAESPAQRIRRFIKVEERKLILSLDRLVAIEDEALRRLLRKIRKHRDRIQVVFK